jgi:transcriptional regulator GlxA family with amidase domain
MPDKNGSWWQLCSCVTDQVNIATAAQIARVTDRTIYLWARRGLIHVRRNGKGLRICKASLELAVEHLSQQGDGNGIDSRVKLVIKLVDQQYARNDPTLSKMAKQVGLSIWYLPRLFKKHTGISFGEYLRNLRLEKAEKLLQDTTLSIKEIAAAVGYKYVSDFDHHFKSAYGICPGEYRRSQQSWEVKERASFPNK